MRWVLKLKQVPNSPSLEENSCQTSRWSGASATMMISLGGGRRLQEHSLQGYSSSMSRYTLASSIAHEVARSEKCVLREIP